MTGLVVRVLIADKSASETVDLKQLIDIDRAGLTALALRDRSGRQRVIVLEDGDERLTIGRAAECDIIVDWDSRVSRVHAELTPLAGGWAIADDGLSRNGTTVNGDRVRGRRRLSPGDTVCCGITSLVFRSPVAIAAATDAADTLRARLELTPTQRKVLVALCLPYRSGLGFGMPASNAAIAEHLVVSVDAVKTHLRALYEKFGVHELPQNAKRLGLAEMALSLGIVTEHDLAGPTGRRTEGPGETARPTAPKNLRDHA
jgi:pSer/pThr/pTyr-binding forkhead associated (FHA) protein